MTKYMEYENNKLKEKVIEYGYDSLCLRYEIARDKQTILEIKEGKNREVAEKLAQRDKLRFFEILRELL